MKRKLLRTILALLVAVGAVLAVRWTIRTAMARAYRAERDMGVVEMPVVPAPRVHSLADLVPEALRVNIAGLAIRRHAERLGMPYELAVDVAAEKAASAGWERMDDENALTVQNLSGMERVYKTPQGSIVLREVRAIRGDDSLMEDFVIPAEMLPAQDEQTTPDVLARRSAQQVKAMMPEVLRDVVAGSPLMTELIERNGGAAFLVHCVAETSAAETARLIAEAARAGGWTEEQFLAAALPGGGEGRPVASWTKANLLMHFETVPRPQGGCDVDYRFADDEVYNPRKETNDEN
ncbi:MAG: hypothetical protein ILO10_07335 [Kiritimatiellae bacterium]|nr:hypothetical protein [Kiritimatiellia bacterium]